jgi:RNA polymerase sigma-70 factor (ECF subfamily)
LSRSSHESVEPIDPESWVDRYGDALYAYARARLRTQSEAEEVVQETFLAALRFQNQYVGPGSQLQWLTSILKRKIIDHFRARARRDRMINQENEFDSAAVLFNEQGGWQPGVLNFIAMSTEDPIEVSELWQIVRHCLSRIPQGQADAFVLSVMEGLNQREICKELRIKPSNLWVRLHRARLALAKCVSQKWAESKDEALSHE